MPKFYNTITYWYYGLQYVLQILIYLSILEKIFFTTNNTIPKISNTFRNPQEPHFLECGTSLLSHSPDTCLGFANGVLSRRF